MSKRKYLEFQEGIRAWYGDPDEQAIWATKRVAEGLCPTELDLFARYLKTPGRVLNVGCGGGREAIELAGMGHEVVAIDLLDSFLEAAKANAKEQDADIRFESGDVTDLKYDDESFDYVVMVGQMIGQVPRLAGRLKALAQCRRVLKSDGLLLCSTNAIELSWKYRAYFQVVNHMRKFYNPYILEPGDTFVLRTGGRYSFFRNRRQRSIYHWYTRNEFLTDLAKTDWHCLESRRRWEHEKLASGEPLMSGETFYVAKKITRSIDE